MGRGWAGIGALAKWAAFALLSLWATRRDPPVDRPFWGSEQHVYLRSLRPRAEEHGIRLQPIPLWREGRILRRRWKLPGRRSLVQPEAHAVVEPRPHRLQRRG